MQAGTITQSTDKKSVRGFAIILHEHDFRELIFLQRAMRHLDYIEYLSILWRRMALVRQAGQRVLVSPFLIDQHISYADGIGALPFSPFAMRAFDAFVTRTSPQTREWRGEPAAHFIANLRAAESMTATGRAPPLSSKRPLDCLAPRSSRPFERLIDRRHLQLADGRTSPCPGRAAP